MVLAHNKIVVQCRAGQVGEGGTAVSLSEVVQQLEGLAATQGLELTGAGAGEAGEEGEGAVLLFNLAVARFQQRRWLQVRQSQHCAPPPSHFSDRPHSWQTACCPSRPTSRPAWPARFCSCSAS